MDPANAVSYPDFHRMVPSYRRDRSDSAGIPQPPGSACPGCPARGIRDKWIRILSDRVVPDVRERIARRVCQGPPAYDRRDHRLRKGSLRYCKRCSGSPPLNTAAGSLSLILKPRSGLAMHMAYLDPLTFFHTGTFFVRIIASCGIMDKTNMKRISISDQGEQIWILQSLTRYSIPTATM